MLSVVERIGAFYRITQILTPFLLVFLIALVFSKQDPETRPENLKCQQAIIYDKNSGSIFSLDGKNEVEKAIGIDISEKLLNYFHSYEENNKSKSIALYNKVISYIDEDSAAARKFKNQAYLVSKRLKKESSKIDIAKNKIKISFEEDRILVGVEGKLKRETRKGLVSQKIEYAITLKKKGKENYDYMVTDIKNRYSRM